MRNYEQERNPIKWPNSELNIQARTVYFRISNNYYGSTQDTTLYTSPLHRIYRGPPNRMSPNPTIPKSPSSTKEDLAAPAVIADGSPGAGPVGLVAGFSPEGPGTTEVAREAGGCGTSPPAPQVVHAAGGLGCSVFSSPGLLVGLRG